MSSLSPRIAQAIHRTAQHAIVLSLEGRHADAVRELLRLQQDTEFTETAYELQLLLAKVLAHKAQVSQYQQADVIEALQAFKLVLLMSPSTFALSSVTLLSIVSRDEAKLQQSKFDRKALIHNIIEDKRGGEAWEELDLFVREPQLNESDLMRCTELLSIDELKQLRISLLVHTLGGRRMLPEMLKELLEVSPLAEEVKVDIETELPGTITATEWVLHFEGDQATAGPASLLLRPSGFIQMGWEEFLQLQLLQAACTVTLTLGSFSCELVSPKGKVQGSIEHSDTINLSFTGLSKPSKRLYYKPISVSNRGATAIEAFISDTRVKLEFDLEEYGEELLQELSSSSSAELHKSCFESLVNNMNVSALLARRPTDYSGFLMLKLPSSKILSAAASQTEAAFIAEIIELLSTLAVQKTCDPLKLFEYLNVWLSIRLKGIEEPEFTNLVVLTYILSTALTGGERLLAELLENLSSGRSIEQKKAALALCCDNFQVQSVKTKVKLYKLLDYPSDLDTLSRELRQVAKDVAWLEFN